MVNTFWIWGLSSLAGHSFYTFLYRQFIMGIPAEMEEAARIDGANTLQVIWKVFAPICKPVISIVFMIEFISIWRTDVKPFMFLDSSKWPLACALMGYSYTLPERPTVVLQPLQLAGAFLFVIPTFIVYLYGQKYIKEGMITSGLKG